MLEVDPGAPVKPDMEDGHEFTVDSVSEAGRDAFFDFRGEELWWLGHDGWFLADWYGAR